MILDVEIDYQALVKCLKHPSALELFGNSNNQDENKEKSILVAGSENNQISLFEAFDQVGGVTEIIESVL
jgi:hypothetical protein